MRCLPSVLPRKPHCQYTCGAEHELLSICASITFLYAFLYFLQGEGITKTLKKVTDDMKAKNRTDRTGMITMEHKVCMGRMGLHGAAWGTRGAWGCMTQQGLHGAT